MHDISYSKFGSESESRSKSRSIYQTSSCSRRVRTKYSIVDNEAENKSPKKNEVRMDRMDTIRTSYSIVDNPFENKSPEKNEVRMDTILTNHSIVNNAAENNKAPKKTDMRMDTAKELVGLVEKPWKAHFEPQSGRGTGSSAPIERARAGSESVAKITPRLLEVEDNLIPSSVRTEVPVQTKNVQVQTVPSSFRVRTEVPVRTKNVQVQTDVPRRHWYNLPFPPLSPSLPSRLLPARPVVYPGPDYYQRRRIENLLKETRDCTKQMRKILRERKDDVDDTLRLLDLERERLVEEAHRQLGEAEARVDEGATKSFHASEEKENDGKCPKCKNMAKGEEACPAPSNSSVPPKRVTSVVPPRQSIPASILTDRRYPLRLTTRHNQPLSGAPPRRGILKQPPMHFAPPITVPKPRGSPQKRRCVKFSQPQQSSSQNVFRPLATAAINPSSIFQIIPARKF